MTHDQPGRLPRDQVKQVCQNLAHLATHLKVTQKTIAEKTGYQQPNIARLYSGSVSPRLEVIFSVLQAINEAASTTYILHSVEFIEDVKN